MALPTDWEPYVTPACTCPQDCSCLKPLLGHAGSAFETWKHFQAPERLRLKHDRVRPPAQILTQGTGT